MSKWLEAFREDFSGLFIGANSANSAESLPNGTKGTIGRGSLYPETDAHSPQHGMGLERGEPSRLFPDTRANSAVSADRLPDPDAFAERAAIIEEGAGVPREWAEGLATLDTKTGPDGVRPERWRRVVDDAGRFLDQWAAKAHALGWTTGDVFGVDARKPEARYDRAGLVWLLDGRPIVAIGPDRAVMRTRTGATLTYYRRHPDDAEAMHRVSMWTLVGAGPANP